MTASASAKCYSDLLAKFTPSLTVDRRQRNGICLLSRAQRMNMFDSGDRYERGDVFYHSGLKLHRHRFKGADDLVAFREKSCQQYREGRRGFRWP